MANINEEKWIEMLEKKADGSYIAKYPKVKSKSGTTFDEHLADDVSQGEVHGLRVNNEKLEYYTGTEWKIASTRTPSEIVNQRVGVLKMWSGTQAQYNSIGVKDFATLYFIIE